MWWKMMRYLLPSAIFSVLGFALACQELLWDFEKLLQGVLEAAAEVLKN